MADNVTRLRPGGTPRVTVVTRLQAAEVDAVTWLAEMATEADGVRPLDEHTTLHLRYGGDDHVRHVLLSADGELAGYAHLDISDAVQGSSGELVVDPRRRRRGHGTALLTALQGASPDGRLRVWAHGDLAEAAALAAHQGLTRVRTLLQLRRPLASAVPDPTLAPGISLRPFHGSDAVAWLAVNRRAFADHPEQGAWTEVDLAARRAESWFNEGGFLLAVDGSDTILGFAWTKVHGAQAHGADRHAHPPIGELYVVGVDPAAQGLGLGRALVLAGLAHLRSLGLPEAMLYVDDDNTAAMRLYASLAFTTHSTDVMYAAVDS